MTQQTTQEVPWGQLRHNRDHDEAALRILKAVGRTSAEEGMRFALNRVLVEPLPDGLKFTATDGKRLVVVEVPVPGVGGEDGRLPLAKPMMLHRDTVKGLKGGVTINAAGQLVTTDKMGAVTSVLMDQTEGAFPNTAGATPARTDSVHNLRGVGFNPSLLRGILEVAGELGPGRGDPCTVVFSFAGPEEGPANQPLRLDAKGTYGTMIGVIMPYTIG